MKKSDLEIKKTEISRELVAIRDLMKTENRVLTEDEVAKVTDLKRDLANVDASLALADDDDSLQRNVATVVTPEPAKNTKPKTSLDLVRDLANSKGEVPEHIKEINRNVAAGVDTQGVFISRFNYGTNGDDFSPKKVAGLTVTESPVSPALYTKMGLTTYPSLNGGTQKLPFMSTILAEEVAEGVGITPISPTTNHVELTPSRVGVQISVSREGLGTYNQATWDGVMKNVLEAIDRKITAKVYAAAYAGATTVTAANAFTKAAFDLLEGSVPVDGKYLMSRASFFSAKSVAIDVGSGKFLANRVSQDFGETYEGSEIFHSGLFTDASTTKYVIYGALSQIAIGFWGQDAYELIIDPFTNALKGELLITVSKLVDIKIPDAATAFVKSADLDPTS